MLDWPQDQSRDAAERLHTSAVSEALAESPGSRPSDHGPALWGMVADAWAGEHPGADPPDWLVPVTGQASKLAGATPPEEMPEEMPPEDEPPPEDETPEDEPEETTDDAGHDEDEDEADQAGD